MSTPKQLNGAKKRKPKPLVMFADFNFCDLAGRDAAKLFTHETVFRVPVLVLPMPSKRAALAKKKWEAMGREQKMEAIAKIVYERSCGQGFRGASEPLGWDDMPPAYQNDYRTTATQILALTGETTP